MGELNYDPFEPAPLTYDQLEPVPGVRWWLIASYIAVIVAIAAMMWAVGLSNT